MKLRSILRVAEFEIRTQVTSPSFKFGVILPVVFSNALPLLLVMFIQLLSSAPPTGVVDEAGILSKSVCTSSVLMRVRANLEGSILPEAIPFRPRMQKSFLCLSTLDEARRSVRRGLIGAAVLIPRDFFTNPRLVVYGSRQDSSAEEYARSLEALLFRVMIADLIPGNPRLKALSGELPVESLEWNGIASDARPRGAPQRRTHRVERVVGTLNILAVFIFSLCAAFGLDVIRHDRTSRFGDVTLTAVSVRDYVKGKLLGVLGTVIFYVSLIIILAGALGALQWVYLIRPFFPGLSASLPSGVSGARVVSYTLLLALGAVSCGLLGMLVGSFFRVDGTRNWTGPIWLSVFGTGVIVSVVTATQETSSPLGRIVSLLPPFSAAYWMVRLGPEASLFSGPERVWSILALLVHALFAYALYRFASVLLRMLVAFDGLSLAKIATEPVNGG